MFRNTLQRLPNVIGRYRFFSPTIAGQTRTVDPTIAALKATAGGSNRVVVLGGGWAGFQIALNATNKLPLTVISPNNHFVFTPLLASTAVGTLEFRCIQEPIRTVLGPQGQFVQAKARSLDPVNKRIICESVHNDTFELEYDKLVIAVGLKTNVSR
jgi:NADH dehydrogenase/NADH:ubiquinone reductase (non-electrogenic)